MDITGIRISGGIDALLLQDWLGAVSETKRARLRRYLRKEDTLRSLLGDVLARMEIGRRFGMSNREIEFAYGPFEKPLLKHWDARHFNISHSGEWVFCAVDTEPVGIDVQEIREMGLDIAESFFSKQEFADLMAQPDRERVSYLFQLWTLKESYIKATGRGFSEGLDGFTIRIRQGRAEMADPGAPVVFRKFESIQGYKLAACSFSPSAACRLRLMGIPEFAGHFHAFMKKTRRAA
jgi:4'-phosphopantetheinyl transferase